MLFDKSRHHRVSEFQAVVLAGYGSSNRLYPISEEDNLPKALLPVANKPIIAYTLDWLEKAGIHGIQGSVHCTVVSIDEDFGTADALRSVKDKIERDFIVVPCDLVTDMDPRNLLDSHRVRDPTLTAMFFEPSLTDSKDEDLLPYVGIDPAQSSLVYKARQSTDEDFSMRMSLLEKFPRVRIHTDLQDAHLYIFKRWVLDMVADKENISSISEDLIPMLVKCQYQQRMVEREKVDDYARSTDVLFKTALSLSTTASPEEQMQGTLDKSWVSPVSTHVYIQRGGVCGRGNTIASYSELNRHATKQGQNIIRVPATAEVAPKTQVGNDAMIGDYTKIDERSSVKKSCIGTHCVIGKNVKIANSIIMDHVVIEDNAKVDGCVIGKNAKILEKASLKDCDVAGEFVVDKETQVKGEKLVAFREAIY
ncbi:nucleotide-diphospho-sugar transferase [Syncephalastrum racemosum]|uniref:Translation initiation factor eIF2B subunit gamma n=1 Tax=Syncephalastrum racemosum TaxID=13706 RepID=A0A1X2HTX5_SYNRA|nr:nucleotide-diphospho-sugar transferase [Syncephalastrum racemosum]